MPLFLVGFWNWLKKVPGEIWIALAILGTIAIGIYTVDRNAVKRTKTKDTIEDLEDTIVLQETSKEIINAIEVRIEHAEESVARLPHFRDADSLRAHDPELAALILNDPSVDER